MWLPHLPHLAKAYDHFNSRTRLPSSFIHLSRHPSRTVFISNAMETSSPIHNVWTQLNNESLQSKHSKRRAEESRSSEVEAIGYIRWLSGHAVGLAKEYVALICRRVEESREWERAICWIIRIVHRRRVAARESKVLLLAFFWVVFSLVSYQKMLNLTFGLLFTEPKKVSATVSMI